MFDCHMHSKLSFDGKADALDMALTARERGLREICFTDHLDHWIDPVVPYHEYDLESYARTYEPLEVPGLVIRRGCEAGLMHWNRAELDRHLSRYPYDFIIGSVHYIHSENPYSAAYWEGKTADQVFRQYLEGVLETVENHDNFDVLGHLTYVSKSPANTTHTPLRYSDYPALIDEILRVLVKKGKGMEINTSGVARVGEFLPSADIFRRFRELGGEIVTMGSDAHNCDRVGDHMDGAVRILKEIFGYVCTFEQRKPIFHKL